jgi:hypothetical protein
MLYYLFWRFWLMECKCENLIRHWKKCSKDFQRLLKTRQEDIKKSKFCNHANAFLANAGELFFQTLGTIEMPSYIPDGFQVEPVGKSVLNVKGYCYREYWLCVLALFCRNESNLLKYFGLSDVTLPYSISGKNKRRIDWSYVQDEFELAKPYIVMKKNHLKSICKASIDLCKLIITLCKEQAFTVDEKTHIVYYRGKPYRLGRGYTWGRFLKLYKANGEPVPDEELGEDNTRQNISEVKQYLKTKGAHKIAAAIKRQSLLGYWLDISSL